MQTSLIQTFAKQVMSIWLDLIDNDFIV